MTEAASQPGLFEERKLRVWDRLELRFYYGEQTGLYIARIEDMRNGKILINRPEWVSGEPLLRETKSCTVTFVRPTSAYQFYTTIEGTMEIGGRELYALQPPVTMKRVQRRRYVRIDLALAFEFKELDKLNREGKRFEDIEWEQAKTRNLSAGGVGFALDRSLDIGTAIAVRIDLPDSPQIVQTLGVVARSFRESEDEIFHGVELLTAGEFARRLPSVSMTRIPRDFKMFGEAERNKLVNFVFNEEVKVRRREIV